MKKDSVKKKKARYDIKVEDTSKEKSSPENETPPPKFPLLLFSGGLDSTYMLYKALQHSTVDILYVDGGQGPNKRKAEEMACKDIVEWFKNNSRLSNTINRDYGTVEVTNLSGSPGILLAQPFTWLVAALKCCDPTIHSSVQIAYVIGDDALVFRHEIQNAWNGLFAFTKRGAVPLEFPLMLIRKEAILRELPPELVELTWSCEFPTWKNRKLLACGECRPCKRSAVEMAEHQKSIAKNKILGGHIFEKQIK